MIAPLQVEFHNTPPIEDVEFRIRRELAELEKFYNHLVSCRIDVELPAHKRQGSMAKVRIDLGVPAARAAAETEHLEVTAQHKDASMAVHAAFNTARRRLKERAG
jgi:ribosome-associated translation inhibitor RaiA